MRIGIISRYFHNQNYGGLLQAYALCRYLNTHFPDCRAEQIAFNSFPGIAKKLKELFFSPLGVKLVFAKESFKLISAFINTRLHKSSVYQYTAKRASAFSEFERIIPHSSKIYTSQNITDSLNEYDIFITGSDQVWNPMWYYPEYFLDFVPYDTLKISYAASISQSFLTPKQQRIFKNSLQSYSSVSVREQNAVSLIKDFSPVTVEWVLDPTLLLEEDEWNKVSSCDIINKPYIFCYFLGEDPVARNICTEFSVKHRLPIAVIPYLQGSYRRCDRNFGDIRLSDISPNEFISLIKNAKYIFTDSFHATVFSHIFKREYFVFERYGEKGMSSRLYSLLTLFDKAERFCDDDNKKLLSYIEALPPIDYSEESQRLKYMKETSYAFIAKAIKHQKG